MAAIDDIEGIGPIHAETLRKAGVITVAHLLERGCEPAGRRELAAATGINEKMLLKWTNMADLFRVKGVAAQYAELLERAGVDTVRELAQRNPESLHGMLTEANSKRRIVRRLPPPGIVEQWVERARMLPRKIAY